MVTKARSPQFDELAADPMVNVEDESAGKGASGSKHVGRKVATFLISHHLMS